MPRPDIRSLTHSMTHATDTNKVHTVLNTMLPNEKFTTADISKALNTLGIKLQSSKSITNFISKNVAKGAIAKTGDRKVGKHGMPLKIYRLVDPAKMHSTEMWFDNTGTRTNHKKRKAKIMPIDSISINRSSTVKKIINLLHDLETKPTKSTLSDYTTAELIAEMQRRMK